MLTRLLVTVGVCTLGFASPVPHDRDTQPAGTHVTTYNQQQHASGNNLRLNMNKILIAILPLEDALAGLGIGSQFEDYSDTFPDLTLDDLKPPPPPPEEEDDEDAENAESTSETVDVQEGNTSESTQAAAEASTTAAPISGGKTSGLVRVPVHRNKAAACKPGDVAAGRCRRTQRRPETRLASLLVPLLKSFQRD